ncbi:exosome non-catalytic core subunit RRP42 ASCRUDRAFT_7141 [Ascoidea rubescens DSM 1968]|uniref:Ribosomal RNA-processing protein 42 n=1 Tax=Ascoidea rubescens DSM 1968 TaxID=1344418 RepID=A0A1D2VLV4_9ASCO|nr:hypothetical protein ASCRUDRAFT_7141 [Ascoidea rubescens DSM 1968]ODV62592.1 hypothetical protein ASCRUDRAFT_7141 [Ascoidea rubescens DSM 1968]
MILSPAERSYLRDSLSLETPIRPDSRLVGQFRPIEAVCNFLPNFNGSSRVRLSDGNECITSVKSSVVIISSSSRDDSVNLIDFLFNIPGYRDDSNLVSNLTLTFNKIFNNNFDYSSLKLKNFKNHFFKLSIDILFISNSSDINDNYVPLTLISFSSYLALRSTRLPLLINDLEKDEEDLNIDKIKTQKEVELPMFSDDWSDSTYLFPTSPSSSTANANQRTPPLIFILAVIDDNLFVDPTIEEQYVSDNGLIVPWCSGNIINPIESTKLSRDPNSDSTSSSTVGLNYNHLTKGISLVKEVAAKVASALDNVVNTSDENEFLNSIF